LRPLPGPAPPCRVPQLKKKVEEDSPIGQNLIVDAFMKALGLLEKSSPARKRVPKKGGGVRP
jgi:hypothetical protein